MNDVMLIGEQGRIEIGDTEAEKEQLINDTNQRITSDHTIPKPRYIDMDHTRTIGEGLPPIQYQYKHEAGREAFWAY